MSLAPGPGTPVWILEGLQTGYPPRRDTHREGTRAKQAARQPTGDIPGAPHLRGPLPRYPSCCRGPCCGGGGHALIGRGAEAVENGAVWGLHLSLQLIRSPEIEQRGYRGDSRHRTIRLTQLHRVRRDPITAYAAGPIDASDDDPYPSDSHNCVILNYGGGAAKFNY